MQLHLSFLKYTIVSIFLINYTVSSMAYPTVLRLGYLCMISIVNGRKKQDFSQL